MKQRKHQNKGIRLETVTYKSPRILIAIPCMDQGPAKFWTSLVNLRKTADTHYGVKANSMIYDSRNNFAAHAIMSGYDRVLWLDSDMTFDPDLLERLNADMDDNGLEVLATGIAEVIGIVDATTAIVFGVGQDDDVFVGYA